MKYFEKYVSNTIAGTGNMHFFTLSDGEIMKCRSFYKITKGGEYNYSFLFTNIIDGTFSESEGSSSNMLCDSWTIHSLRTGKCKYIPSEKKLLPAMIMADADENPDADIIVTDFVDVTFGGKKEKEVMPGEFFATDPVKLNFQKDEYVCLEMECSGRMIPYHEASILPLFRKTKNGWEFNTKVPVAGMIGCDKEVSVKIGFLGDSITQGIGTMPNRYLHWTALITDMLGEKYGCWNMGLGYARANDTASNGAWMFKAKQNDIVVLCIGTNDIGRGFPLEQIKRDLARTMQLLKDAGIKVVLQSLPPYTDMKGMEIEKTILLNSYIRNVLAPKADLFFDIAPHLWESPETPTISKYNSHPNAEGCAVWAEELYKVLGGFVESYEANKI